MLMYKQQHRAHSWSLITQQIYPSFETMQIVVSVITCTEQVSDPINVTNGIILYHWSMHKDYLTVDLAEKKRKTYWYVL